MNNWRRTEGVEGGEQGSLVHLRCFKMIGRERERERERSRSGRRESYADKDIQNGEE